MVNIPLKSSETYILCKYIKYIISQSSMFCEHVMHVMHDDMRCICMTLGGVM